MLPRVFIVMGVAGSGKTTIGTLLASRLGCAFSDADQFHTAQNKLKMGSGVPLTDEDRAPWLASMREAIEHWVSQRQGHVLACSALKESYREILAVDPALVVFIYLDAPRELIEARLSARQHHYMKADMVESQFATLEAPDTKQAIVVDARMEPDRIVDEITRSLPDYGKSTR